MRDASRGLSPRDLPQKAAALLLSVAALAAARVAYRGAGALPSNSRSYRWRHALVSCIPHNLMHFTKSLNTYGRLLVELCVTTRTLWPWHTWRTSVAIQVGEYKVHGQHELVATSSCCESHPELGRDTHSLCFNVINILFLIRFYISS